MSDAKVKWIYNNVSGANCFFRSALEPPHLKVMIQITERCNMRCKHCFLSATSHGEDLSLHDFRFKMMDKLVRANVKKVTLTGGEPLLNSALVDIVTELYAANIQTGICTNASLISEALLQQLLPLHVHFNVSLDGINNSSYGVFRGLSGDQDFQKISKNIRLIGSHKMLNGILVTPNNLIKSNEYRLICDLAVNAEARYLLLNPLSPFGRGRYATGYTLSASDIMKIQSEITSYVSDKYGAALETVFIRFPNQNSTIATNCCAGSIPYIFTNGDIAICPYTVFAASSEDNSYSRESFLVGNIFDEIDLQGAIKEYQASHDFCQCGSAENPGCAAIKISKGLPLSSTDIL